MQSPRTPNSSSSGGDTSAVTTQRYVYHAAHEQDARTIADALRSAGFETSLNNRNGWYVDVIADPVSFERVWRIVRETEPPNPVAG